MNVYSFVGIEIILIIIGFELKILVDYIFDIWVILS